MSHTFKWRQRAGRGMVEAAGVEHYRRIFSNPVMVRDFWP
jgi:hypothetical protein